MSAPETLARHLLQIRADARPVILNQWPASPARPADETEAYAAQEAAEAIRTGEQGLKPIGYKIGATNQLARDLLGVTTPFYGRLYDGSSGPGPGRLELKPGVNLVVEPEVAVRLGRDLDAAGGPVTAADAEAAVEALLPIFEVVDSCFVPWTEAGGPLLIADNGAHGSWVMGTEVTDWQGFDPLDSPVTVRGAPDGTLTGTGRAVDGGAFGAVAWLANKLAARGRRLKAGEYVSTGTVTPPIALARGQELTADFGPLGRVSLHVT